MATELTHPKTTHLPDLSVQTTDDIDLEQRLIVYNDHVNTFDWVIKSLMDVCNHSLEQAEQCALIIHFKGLYAVKHGPRIRLAPMREGLVDRGINAALEE